MDLLVERDDCCCWEGAREVRKSIAEKWVGGVGRLRYSGGLMVWCKRHLGGEDSVCGRKRVTPMFYRRIVVGPHVGLVEHSSL